MTKCPFCEEEIQGDETFCPHCTFSLPPVEVAKQDTSEQIVPPLEVLKTTEKPPQKSSPKKPVMKICPFCDGEIREDSIKCWHCTMDLPSVKVAKQDTSEKIAPPPKVSMIKCPFCEEEIQGNATFCPHCTFSLPPVEVAKQDTSEQIVPPPKVLKMAEKPPQRPSPSPLPSPPQRAVGKPLTEKNKRSVNKWVIWVGICISVLILLLLAGSFVAGIISQKADYFYLLLYGAMIIGDIAIIAILYSLINVEWEIKLQEIWDDYKVYIMIFVPIIILGAGILFTISNLSKMEKPVPVAIPKVEAPVAQPESAPVSQEELERIAKENYFNAIRSAHPDFDNLRNSGRIVAWIQKQPSHLRDSMLKTYVEGDADSVIALLNQFKKDKNSTQLHKDKVIIPAKKKDVYVPNRPVAEEQHYKAIEGLSGIELNDGNIIEGQIISFNGDTVKIRTKDGRIITYSFMKEVKRFIHE